MTSQPQPRPVADARPQESHAQGERLSALTCWTQRAEAGAFDFAGHGARERTRARFDGTTLSLERWIDGAEISTLRLRQAGPGDWRAQAAGSCILCTGEMAGRAELNVCQDLQGAFERHPPSQALSWSERILWGTRWAGAPRAAP